jgi:hypothetical protein
MWCVSSQVLPWWRLYCIDQRTYREEGRWGHVARLVAVKGFGCLYTADSMKLGGVPTELRDSGGLDDEMREGGPRSLRLPLESTGDPPSSCASSDSVCVSSMLQGRELIGRLSGAKGAGRGAWA